MFIPWNTDAPIYHGPWATIAIIVITIAAFIATFSDDGSMADPWVLHYGTGLHPIEWVTSNFMHADIMHLIGNMIFLWSFGLVVEGKIGWLWFVPIYLGMGTIASAIEQAIMLGAPDGGSLGASGIIFGLLAMTIVWAPKNDYSCIALFRLRPIFFDVPILTFGFLNIGMNLLFAWLGGFQMSSEMLHLGGASIGFIVGVVMLKAGLVDCEGWDLFAVIAGREGEARDEKLTDQPPPSPDPQANLAALESIRRLLREGKGHLALNMQEKLSRTRPGWQLPQRELLALVDALEKEQPGPKPIPVLVECLRRFPENAQLPRLKLAQILLRENRPAQALRVMEKLPQSPLPEKMELIRSRLINRATKMRDEGVMELASEDW